MEPFTQTPNPVLSPTGRTLMTFRSWSGVLPRRRPGPGLMPTIGAKHIHLRHRLPQLHLAILNVRTLLCRHLLRADGSLNPRGFDRLEVLKHRMLSHQLWAMALCEVRLDGSGHLPLGDDFHLVWQGCEATPGYRGVAFLLSPAAHKAWTEAGSCAVGKPSGRLLRLKFAAGGRESPFHLVASYGPTMQNPQPEHDLFWQDLNALWAAVPRSHLAWVLGDLNCRVGSRVENDLYGSCLGPYGVGPRNDSGHRLLAWAAQHELVVLNTLFNKPLSQRITHAHSHWGTPGQIDLALGRQGARQHVLDCHACPGFEFDTDHRLVIVKLRCSPPRATAGAELPPEPQPQQPPLELTARARPFAVDKLVAPAMAKAFCDEVNAKAPSCHSFASWNQVLREAGEEVVGFARGPRSTDLDWRSGNEDVLKGMSEARQSAFDQWQAHPTPHTYANLHAARHNSRTIVRQLKNAAWQAHMRKVEEAARSKNPSSVFADIRHLARLVAPFGVPW